MHQETKKKEKPMYSRELEKLVAERYGKYAVPIGIKEADTIIKQGYSIIITTLKKAFEYELSEECYYDYNSIQAVVNCLCYRYYLSLSDTIIIVGRL